MILSLERGRHSDKWHNLYEPGGLCARKNQPVKRKGTVVSFTLGACKSQALRKKAEEMVGEKLFNIQKELSTAGDKDSSTVV